MRILAVLPPPYDIETFLTTLDGKDDEERLGELYSYCINAVSMDNPENEIRALRVYQKEADLSKLEKHQVFSRTMRMYAYYNNNMPDSLRNNISEVFEFLEEYSRWREYFSCYCICILRMQYDNNLQYALQVTEKMQAKALEVKDPYGIGLSEFLYGASYLNMRRYKEAQEYFDESKKYFTKIHDCGLMHNVYSIEWKSLCELNRYDELLKNTAEWEQMWDEYYEEHHVDNKAALNPYYLGCYSVRAHALIDLKRFPEAEAELEKVRKIVKENQLKDIAIDIWLQEEGRLAYYTGNYKKSMEYIDRLIKIRVQLNNNLEIIRAHEARARVLAELGRFEEALEIYREIYAKMDTIYQTELHSQLDEMNAIYKVDTLKQEKDQLRLYIFNLAIILGVLVFSIFLYFVYKSSLRQKNQVIKKFAVKESETVRQVATLMEKLPQEMLSNEEKLFIRIKNLLKDKEVLLDPSLNREQLAFMLDTNHRIVSETIKNQSGHSFMEFINGLRVDYACEIMRQKGKVSVRDLADMCGFNSYTTFYRTFCTKMGMTPSEFITEQKGENQNKE